MVDVPLNGSVPYKGQYLLEVFDFAPPLVRGVNVSVFPFSAISDQRIPSNQFKM